MSTRRKVHYTSACQIPIRHLGAFEMRYLFALFAIPLPQLDFNLTSTFLCRSLVRAWLHDSTSYSYGSAYLDSLVLTPDQEPFNYILCILDSSSLGIYIRPTAVQINAARQ